MVKSLPCKMRGTGAGPSGHKKNKDRKLVMMVDGGPVSTLKPCKTKRFLSKSLPTSCNFLSGFTINVKKA